MWGRLHREQHHSRDPEQVPSRRNKHETCKTRRNPGSVSSNKHPDVSPDSGSGQVTPSFWWATSMPMPLPVLSRRPFCPPPSCHDSCDSCWILLDLQALWKRMVMLHSGTSFGGVDAWMGVWPFVWLCVSSFLFFSPECKDNIFGNMDSSSVISRKNLGPGGAEAVP